jgi:hypothetical protein
MPILSVDESNGKLGTVIVDASAVPLTYTVIVVLDLTNAM